MRLPGQLPERVFWPAAHAFARTAPLRVLRLPFTTPTFPIALLWHRRFDDLPAHKWLRGMVGKVAKSLRR